MTGYAIQVVILLSGLILLATNVVAPTSPGRVARSPSFRSANAGRGIARNSFNNRGTGTQDFSGAVINSGEGAGGQKNAVINANGVGGFDDTPEEDNTFRNMRRINWFGPAIEINNNGITLRGINVDKRGVSLRNKRFFIGDKAVCEDVTKAPKEATYQKTADGGLWHANIQIGQPMTEADIQKFEGEWAKHAQKEQAKAAEKEARNKRWQDERAQLPKTKGALNMRYQRQAVDRRWRAGMPQEDQAARVQREAADAERRAKMQADIMERRARSNERRAKRPS